MTFRATPPSPLRLYSPRNPLLRTFLIVLVACFVICHKGFSRLFKTGIAAPSLAPAELAASLSRNPNR